MYSFLLIGQSNASGRGFIDEVEKLDNTNLYSLRNGRWWPMYSPVNCDRVTAGISLAESFAYNCAKDFNTEIGIIPCADGGTCLDQWEKGDVLYDHAVMMAQLAQRSSEIAGVLWHQGESDCGLDRYMHYKEKCMKIFENLKKDLNLSDDVPFLIGGLGDFLKDYKNKEISKNYPVINRTLEKMADENDYIGFVPATGLTANPDNLHFNAKSLREFGIRYFEKFKEMNKIMKYNQGADGNITYTDIEKL